MCAKVGRPLSANPKTIEIKARITPETYQNIKDDARSKKTSISAVIRLALKTYFEGVNK